MDVLLSEKYRPRKLDEVLGHQHIISRLKKFLEQEEPPHLLFVGPPGT